METSTLLAMKGKMSYPCGLSELSEMSDYYGLYTEAWVPRVVVSGDSVDL